MNAGQIAVATRTLDAVAETLELAGVIAGIERVEKVEPEHDEEPPRLALHLASGAVVFLTATVG